MEAITLASLLYEIGKISLDRCWCKLPFYLESFVENKTFLKIMQRLSNFNKDSTNHWLFNNEEKGVTFLRFIYDNKGSLLTNSFNLPSLSFFFIFWAYNLITIYLVLCFQCWAIVCSTTSWDVFHFSKLTFTSSVQALLLLIMPWTVKPHIGILAILAFSLNWTLYSKSVISPPFFFVSK